MIDLSWFEFVRRIKIHFNFNFLLYKLNNKSFKNVQNFYKKY